MQKKNKLLKIIKWFFEEDVNEDQNSTDTEDISIGPAQIVLIIFITVIFLLWIFYGPVKEYFYKPGPDAPSYIETNIEKNYFSKNNIENGDFSQNLEHWITSDAGELFPDSKSIASIETNDFYSAPSSMKIECITPANRYHYSKDSSQSLVNNAYGFLETSHWMGVLPGSQVRGSLCYKGDVIKFAINGLTSDGEWFNLANAHGPATSQWKRIEISEKVPPNGRAIMLEITLNQAQGMPTPVVLIDDVKLEVDDINLEIDTQGNNK